MSRDEKLKWIYTTIFFAFLSVLMASAENLIPRPLPYLRLGLAFIPILIIIEKISYREAIFIIFAKSLTLSLLFASFLTPAFIMGLSGGLASVVVMKSLSKMPRIFSLVGVSLAGSVVSNCVQLITARVLFDLPNLLRLVPLIVIFASVSGIVTGIIALFTAKRLKETTQLYSH